MTDWRQATIDTYNKSAVEMAEYFAGIGSRTDDIDKAIELAGSPEQPVILEIGCGDGRDAAEIVKRTTNYLGFDIAESFINLARNKVPAGRFELGDAVTFEYARSQWDIVFAFASLLHLNREENRDVFRSVNASLKPGGVFFVSLKYAPEYTEKLKEDKFGTRLFYFYSPQSIMELAGNSFEAVWQSKGFITGKDTEWIEMAFRKK